MLAAAAWRFRRNPDKAVRTEELPPVSVLKPLCGLEPGLEENLEGFFLQDYPCYELLFIFHSPLDPALAVVERLRARHPMVTARVYFSGEPDKPNAKVCSLREAYAHAAYEYLVISDSDVQVTPGYLRAVVPPLLDPKVGVVTCLYRGIASGGPWSRLEALGMGVEMTAGVVISGLMGELNFALGPSMSTRRDVLRTIGGFDRMADYCADDFVLGNWAHRAGYKVHLSRHVIGHVAMNRGFLDSMLHQVRWMRSTRFSLPAGHALSVLSFAMPFGLLLAAIFEAGHRPLLALTALAVAVGNRMLMSCLAGGFVTRDKASVAFCWLYPVRDLMGFFFWCASYLGNTILWRQQQYRLMEEGRMERCTPLPSDVEVAAGEGLS